MAWLKHQQKEQGFVQEDSERTVDARYWISTSEFTDLEIRAGFEQVPVKRGLTDLRWELGQATSTIR